MSSVSRRVLPGFVPSLSFTLLYLTVLLIIPLAACFLRAASLSPAQFWAAVGSERALAAYGVTFGASLAAALISVLLGLIVAWVLVRYGFPLKRFFDALVDLPFALPTAVAGLVYSSLYVEKGWLGQFLVPAGATVRVQLMADELGLVINVEVNRERYTELGLRLGQTVFASPRQVRLFVPEGDAPLDYAI